MSIKILSVTSLEDSLARIHEISDAFREGGLVVLRGFKFSEEDHIEIASRFSEYNKFSVGTVYQGGHSDSSEKAYSLSTKDYALHWHIEKPYYVVPIYAGIWNMHHFTSMPGTGQTLFVDSSKYYDNLSKEEQEFLDACTFKWDKRIEGIPDGAGPFYTKAVEMSPITGKKTIRVDVDPGSILAAELHTYEGWTPTPEQASLFKGIIETLGYALYDDMNIRMSHSWEQGDLLFIDLFSMYHAVSAGYTFGQRKFTGITLRGPGYESELADALHTLPSMQSLDSEN